MAAKAFLVLAVASFVAAEPSYSTGVALHPTGTSFTARSPQGLQALRPYGLYHGLYKREAEPSYSTGVALHPTGTSFTARSAQGLQALRPYGLYHGLYKR